MVMMVICNGDGDGNVDGNADRVVVVFVIVGDDALKITHHHLTTLNILRD